MHLMPKFRITTLFLVVLACAAIVSVLTLPILNSVFSANILVLAMCYLLGKSKTRVRLASGIGFLYLLCWFFTYLDSKRTVASFAYKGTELTRQLSVEPRIQDLQSYQLAPWVFTGQPTTPCAFIVVFDQSSLNVKHVGFGVRTWVIWCFGKPYLIGREFRWASV